jgi:hypothetical protein
VGCGGHVEGNVGCGGGGGGGGGGEVRVLVLSWAKMFKQHREVPKHSLVSSSCTLVTIDGDDSMVDANLWLV